MGFLDSIFGSVPEAATFNPVKYTPTDYGAVQLDTIQDNLGAQVPIADLLNVINAETTRQGMGRIESLSPGFMEGVSSMQDTAGSLLSGQLPFTDVLDIVGDGQNARGSLGTFGTHTSATLRDLGLSQLGAMQTGTEFMARIANLAEQVDPVGRHGTPMDFSLQPSQTVPLAQQDNQFAATFALQNEIARYDAEQNANNLDAAADPAAANLFGLATSALGFGSGGGFGGNNSGNAAAPGGGGLGGLTAPALPASSGAYGTGGASPGFNPDSSFSSPYKSSNPQGSNEFWSFGG